MKGKIVYCVCRDVGGSHSFRLELVSVHESKKDADSIVDKKNSSANITFIYYTKRKNVK